LRRRVVRSEEGKIRLRCRWGRRRNEWTHGIQYTRAGEGKNTERADVKSVQKRKKKTSKQGGREKKELKWEGQKSGMGKLAGAGHCNPKKQQLVEVRQLRGQRKKREIEGKNA